MRNLPKIKFAEMKIQKVLNSFKLLIGAQPFDQSVLWPTKVWCTGIAE